MLVTKSLIETPTSPEQFAKAFLPILDVWRGSVTNFTVLFVPLNILTAESAIADTFFGTTT